MCFKKMKKEIKIFQLSNEAVDFIKVYLLPELNVQSKIDGDLLEDFLRIAFDWESLMVDEKGYDKNYDYPDKERNEMADKFVTEVSGRWSSGLWIPDFEDLNKRLGLQ